jgi:uncharacterized radical SAM superfamily Fe-S cluster-containing enzyme
MLPEDWLRVINEVAQLGGQMVQFIGGELTLHRSLPEFVDHALVSGLEVEVFSNLVHVSPQLWETFTHPDARLCTPRAATAVRSRMAVWAASRPPFGSER